MKFLLACIALALCSTPANTYTSKHILYLDHCEDLSSIEMTRYGNTWTIEWNGDDYEVKVNGFKLVPEAVKPIRIGNTKHVSE